MPASLVGDFLAVQLPNQQWERALVVAHKLDKLLVHLVDRSQRHCVTSVCRMPPTLISVPYQVTTGSIHRLNSLLLQSVFFKTLIQVLFKLLAFVWLYLLPRNLFV